MSETPTIHGTCDPRFARVRDVFAENFRERDEVGAAVALTLDGRPVVDLWAGHADQMRTRPWERNTIVNVYSTTKGMTALCLHRLVEQGRVDLDAPVARYWPEFAAAGKAEIPLRWVLSHRAGLPLVEADLSTEQVLAWNPVVEAIATQNPMWPSGSQHGYHTRTYGFILGEVVRRVTGVSLRRLDPGDVRSDGVTRDAVPNRTGAFEGVLPTRNFCQRSAKAADIRS